MMARRKTTQPRDGRGRFMRRPRPVLLSALQLQQLLYHTVIVKPPTRANILELPQPMDTFDAQTLAQERGR